MSSVAPVPMRHVVGPPGGRQALSMQPGHMSMLLCTVEVL